VAGGAGGWVATRGRPQRELSPGRVPADRHAVKVEPIEPGEVADGIGNVLQGTGPAAAAHEAGPAVLNVPRRPAVLGQ